MAETELPRSRAEAKRIGSPIYFTGKSCPKGHISPRSVYNAGCEACDVKAARARYQCNSASKTRRLEANAAYVARNAKAVRAKQDAWYRANAERLREKAKLNGAKWRAAHPDKHAAKERNRRALKRSAEGVHTVADIAAIRVAQKNRCACCRVKLSGKGDVDHIVPLFRGGSNWPANLQILCEFCNGSKGSKDPLEFMQQRGFLL
jgi:5-methylcytosine-specific restriction endonuclease McrA